MSTIPPEGGKDSYTRDRMQTIARLVDEETPQGWGFFVMVFPFGGSQGRMNYVCNADRDEIRKLMLEFITKGGAKFQHVAASEEFVTTEGCCSACGSTLKNAETARLNWQPAASELGKEVEKLKRQNEAMRTRLLEILEVADLIDDETGHQTRLIQGALAVE